MFCCPSYTYRINQVNVIFKRRIPTMNQSINGLNAYNSERGKDKEKSNSKYREGDNNSTAQEDRRKGIEVKAVNHFLAIRIKNPEIQKKVLHLQNVIKLKKPIFEAAFVSIPTLHITLNVLNLNTEEEKLHTLDILEKSLEDLKQILQKYDMMRELEFFGLNNFENKVLYVDLVENSSLKFVKELASFFQNLCKSENVNIKEEQKPYRPHLTVMKLSKCMGIMRKEGITKIPIELYKEQNDMSFGNELFKEILLCSMTDRKTIDGFYKILGTINLEELKLSRTLNTKTFESLDSSSK